MEEAREYEVVFIEYFVIIYVLRSIVQECRAVLVWTVLWCVLWDGLAGICPELVYCLKAYA